MQLIVQVFCATLHELQPAGQPLVASFIMRGPSRRGASICEPATTQKPALHTRPLSQSELMVHRARQGFVQQRTATINRIRGLLSEFGIVLPLRAAVVRREAILQLEDLPGWANTVIGDLLSEIHRLDERI